MIKYERDERLTHNFWLHEVRCKCGECPGLPEDMMLAYGLVSALQAFREMFWNPANAYECKIQVTSWYRCPGHNASAKVGGSPESQHLLGNAADCVVLKPDGGVVDPDLVAMMARASGLFSGIICYPQKNMVHLDRRRDVGKPDSFWNFGPFPPIGGGPAAWVRKGGGRR